MEPRQIKDTRIHLVEELRKLPQSPGVDIMIKEALAGEFHDFKNKKYDCGKVASVLMLESMKHYELANRIKDGEFDEQPDDEDKAVMRETCLKGGFTEEQVKVLFGL